jgi:acetyltransferase-like isoleucine patch superfamily enzyme
MLIISEQARISDKADIEDSVRGSRIVICAGVVIDAFVKIKPVGGSGDVVIGENSYLNSGTVIYSGNGVEIGSGVLIAANCTLAPVNHEFRTRNVPIAQQGFKPSKGGITIADDVWIGAGCVILDGAQIGKGCVIGALSLVKEKLEPYTIYAGNPLAKIAERPQQ